MRQLLPLTRLVVLLAASGVVSSVAWSQEADHLRASHRAGQTFLVWDELGDTGTLYRIYRSPRRILTEADLDGADLLGEVDATSSMNRGRTFAAATQHNWIIEPGGAQLEDEQGLFVHTVEERWPLRSASRPLPAMRGWYYAVTSLSNGIEDRTLVANANTTTSELREGAAPAEPVLQTTDGAGELWGHWVGNRSTPYQGALSMRPSHGFNFRYEPGSAPGPRGLMVRLHAAGQTYGIGWPHRNQVQSDVDILALSDLYQGPGFTLWLGAHENFPDLPAPQSRIHLFTLKRVKWTLDWITRRLGEEHDPERVYAVGASMGAMGSFYLATEYPRKFAAILCRNGNYDLAAPDIANPDFVQWLFGDYALNLPIEGGAGSDGLGIYDRTNGSLYAQLAPQAEGPVIRTINGRNDGTVGWQSAVALYEGLDAARRPSVHYFDERTHTPFGYWQALEAQLLARTFATRRDRPSLRLTDLSIDDNPGSGSPSDGDTIGTLNAYVEYDSVPATPDACEFDVFLRSSGSLDDASIPNAQVRLTPRRTYPFVISPGQAVYFSLLDGDTVLEQHTLVADQFGLVLTPKIKLKTSARTARFSFTQPPGRGR